jgi:AraC family transcriptional regulator
MHSSRRPSRLTCARTMVRRSEHVGRRLWPKHGELDRSYKWRSFFTEPVKWVLFHVPRDSLRAYALQNGYTSIELPSVEDGLRHEDVTLAHLAKAVLPALAAGDPAQSGFLDHIFHAVIDHIVRSYCTVCQQSSRDRAPLAVWQLRRVEQYAGANLGQKITIADLASVCGLSTNHFGSSFKRAVGYSPHQWLLEQRVDRAKRLLVETDDTLSEIAAALGFADQSHFTSVFSRRAKVSPAAWRRASVV